VTPAVLSVQILTDANQSYFAGATSRIVATVAFSEHVHQPNISLLYDNGTGVCNFNACKILMIPDSYVTLSDRFSAHLDVAQLPAEGLMHLHVEPIIDRSGNKAPPHLLSNVVAVDVTAPTLLSVNVSSNNRFDDQLAMPGDTVTVVIRASELINEPSVSLRYFDSNMCGSGCQFRMAVKQLVGSAEPSLCEDFGLVTCSEGGGVAECRPAGACATQDTHAVASAFGEFWVAKYNVTAASPEGLIDIVVSGFADRSANTVAYAYEQNGSVTLDTTAPAVDSLNVSTTGSIVGGVRFARAGDTVMASFMVTEPIKLDMLAVILYVSETCMNSTCGVAMAVNQTRGAALRDLFTATYTVDASSLEGVLYVRISGLTDASGNLGAAHVAGPVLTIDKTPPSVSIVVA
jgi:hypothetical protein